MEILVNRSEQSVQLKKEQKLVTRKAVKKAKDRRKASLDRRYSVNEGVLVRLSTRKDRRAAKERRAGTQHSDFLENIPLDSSQDSKIFQTFV